MYPSILRQPEIANQFRYSKVSTRCAPGTGTGEGDAGSQVLDMGRRRGAAVKVPRITNMRRAPGLVLVVTNLLKPGTSLMLRTIYCKQT